MIIDSHVHVVGNPASKAPDYITVKRDAVLLRRRHPDIFAAHWDRLEDMSDLLIEDMDAFGIDKAVVQPGSGESPELVAQAVAKYPDRLVGLFMSGVQAVTRVNAEQASKRTLHGPTRYPLRGRLEGLGKRARSAPPNLTSRGGVSTHLAMDRSILKRVAAVLQRIQSRSRPSSPGTDPTGCSAAAQAAST